MTALNKFRAHINGVEEKNLDQAAWYLQQAQKAIQNAERELNGASIPCIQSVESVSDNLKLIEENIYAASIG